MNILVDGSLNHGLDICLTENSSQESHANIHSILHLSEVCSSRVSVKVSTVSKKKEIINFVASIVNQ
jgi:hypothetical protein